MGDKKLFTYQTLVHAVAGATGSVVAMASFFPLDTVRSRLQLDEEREAKNTLKVLLDLIKEEGVYTLYRGMVPVLESLCASNFVYFYTFHGLKSLRPRNQDQNVVKDLVFASVAGIVNVLTTTPLWVVNTRLKMKGVQNSNSVRDSQYLGLIDGIAKIAHDEGVSSLWSGTVPSLILVANPVLNFVIYEAVKRRLHSLYGVTEFSAGAYFLIGALAKAIATVATYPLQLVQTKLRHGDYSQNDPVPVSTLQMFSYIAQKNGIGGLYKGMEAKIIQTVLTAALMFATYEKIANFIFKVMLSNHKTAATKL